jgi:hypothetical protein
VAKQKLEEKSKLVPLLNSDPKFFYYGGNNNGSGLGRFNQTSYGFGHDRPRNGSSDQPYITTKIPRGFSNNPVDDGFIRGGWFLANKASNEDQLRITKFVNSKPKGTLFIQRQIGLQLSNPKLETRTLNLTGFGLLGGLLTVGFNAFNQLTPGPTRLYNQGRNTLAQLSKTAFGTHFERHGLSPVQDDNTKYLAVVRNNNENGNNRLLALKRKLIRPNITNPNRGNIILGTINAILGAVNVFNTARGKGTNPLLPTSPLLQPQDLIIDRYAGGPGSVYGVGFTTIRRYDVTSNGSNKPIPSKGQIDYAGAVRLSNDYQPPAAFGSTLTNTNPSIPTSKPSQVDQTAVPYKTNIPAGANGTIFSPTARNYANLKEAVEQLKVRDITIVTTATEGFKTDERTGRAIGLDPNADKLSNWAYYGRRRLASQDPTVSLYDNTNEFDRIDSKSLTIVFKAINPFDGKSYPFLFSGYIKGYKDNFDATWNEYNYTGRSESFYTYGKFKRSVSFNLDIPCFNKTQLFEKHRALGQLAATTAGAYNNNGLLGGVILQVKLGNYLDNEYAILNSISYEIPDDSSWDINEKLAMYIRSNISLTIIHSKESRPAQYTTPEVDSKSGFFGYLKNPINTRLDENYKKDYAARVPSAANLNVNRFNNAVNQTFIPGLSVNNPNATTALQNALNRQANQVATQVNPLTNQLLSNQRVSPAAVTNFQKYNQQKSNELLLKSKYGG